VQDPERRHPGAVTGIVSAGAITNVPPRPEQALRVQRVQAGVQHRDPRAGILTAGRPPGGLATDAERKAAKRTSTRATRAITPALTGRSRLSRRLRVRSTARWCGKRWSRGAKRSTLARSTRKPFSIISPTVTTSVRSTRCATSSGARHGCRFSPVVTATCSRRSSRPCRPGISALSVWTGSIASSRGLVRLALGNPVCDSPSPRPATPPEVTAGGRRRINAALPLWPADTTPLAAGAASWRGARLVAETRAGQSGGGYGAYPKCFDPRACRPASRSPSSPIGT